jgi:hypothetical protein
VAKKAVLKARASDVVMDEEVRQGEEEDPYPNI